MLSEQVYPDKEALDFAFAADSRALCASVSGAVFELSDTAFPGVARESREIPRPSASLFLHDGIRDT